MLLLSSDQGDSVSITHFPFTIGRSPSAGLRLDSLGVWDVHATVELRGRTFHIKPEGSALLLINDERSEGAVLRMGDRISIGATRLVVALAPARQQRLAAREALNWLVIAGVVITQVFLFLSIR